MNRFSACFLAWYVALFAASGASAATLADVSEVAGEATDFSGLGDVAPFDRLGGFGSDLYFDRFRGDYYGLVDAGSAVPAFPYATRVQRFTLEVDPATGELGNFALQATIPFKTADGSAHFVGTGPRAQTGDSSALGLSFDPEGFVVAPNGNFYVADEFGPALYEFRPVQVGDSVEARFVRSFGVPAALLPVDSLGQINYSARRGGDPSLVSGRQENRGFEGLAISPDGTSLFAVMQGPLVEEGFSNNGRFSRNLRIVEFDVASGQSSGQFIYQLESIASANDRLPGFANDFLANDQGRDIGVSAIVALNDHELLVLERDSRGVSAANPLNENNTLSAVAIKRVYSVDLSTGSDASGINLVGVNELPPGFMPVDKTLLLDIQAELEANGLAIPERIEGLSIGPQLASGEYALLAITDNDFSILQMDSGERLEVYTDGAFTPVDFPLAGKTLLPTQIFSFAVELPNYVAPVPEPGTAVMLGLGFTLFIVSSTGKVRGRVNFRTM